jgi:hydrogenase maturation protease
VRRLVAEGLPGGCEVEELHGGWLTLLGRLGQWDRIVVVDAVDLGLSPGELVELEFPSESEVAPPEGGHALGLQEVLAIAAVTGEPLPGEVRVLGIQVADVASFSERCSGPVEAAIPLACASIRRILAGVK